MWKNWSSNGLWRRETACGACAGKSGPGRKGRQAALPLDELDDPDERDELDPDFDDPELDDPEFDDTELEPPEFDDPEFDDPEDPDPDPDPDSDLAEDDPFAAAPAGVFESDELDEPLEESEPPAEPAVDAEELSLPFARESVR
jgi:hypothetical protein